MFRVLIANVCVWSCLCLILVMAENRSNLYWVRTKRSCRSKSVDVHVDLKNHICSSFGLMIPWFKFLNPRSNEKCLAASSPHSNLANLRISSIEACEVSMPSCKACNEVRTFAGNIFRSSNAVRARVERPANLLHESTSTTG